MKVPFAASSCQSRDFHRANTFRDIRCCFNELIKTPKRSVTKNQETPKTKNRSLSSTKNPIKHKMSFRSSTLPCKKRFTKIESDLDKRSNQSLFHLTGLASYESSAANQNGDNKTSLINNDITDVKITPPKTSKRRFLGIKINKKRCKSLDSKCLEATGNELESGNIYSGRNSDVRANIATERWRRVEKLKLSKVRSLSRKSSIAALFESRSPELTAVLYDKTLMRLFHKFLKGEHSEENLEFWVECDLYRREGRGRAIKRKWAEGEKKVKMAQHLLTHFLDDSSPKQVNLPSSVRKPIQMSIRNNVFYRELFDEAQMLVFLIMANDCLPRFQASFLYIKYAHAPHSHLRGVRRDLKQNQRRSPVQQMKKNMPSPEALSSKFTMPSFHL